MAKNELAYRKFLTDTESELAEWIQEYFAVEEDLSEFSRGNRNAYLTLNSNDNSRGYVFAGPLQLDRNYEGRMIKMRRFYSNQGKEILKSFTDFEEQIAGFSWRK